MNKLTVLVATVAITTILSTPAHARYADGMNLYQYVQSRPTVAMDPMGLVGNGPDDLSNPPYTPEMGAAEERAFAQLGMTTIESDCMCGPDVTDWFSKELEIHAAYFDAVRSWQWAGDGFFPRLTMFNRYAKRIPYKWMDFHFSDGAKPSGKCANTVTFNGTCIHKSELGNMMFGMVSRAIDISEPLTIAGANRAKAIDSPQDMAGVLAGMQMGQAYRDQGYPKNWSRDVMTGAMATVHDYLYEGLSERFTGDTDTYLDAVNEAGLLPTMGENYRSCVVAGDGLSAGENHSSFAGLPNLYRDRRTLIDATTEYWDVYVGVQSDMVDISGLPTW